MAWTDFGSFLRTRDPWQEFERMQKLFWDMTAQPLAEFPAVNVWLSGDDAAVTSELPGVDPAMVDISVVGKTLTVKGSRPAEENGNGASHHRRERWHGSFSRTVDLPFQVDPDKVEARFSKGVLTISLPRAEADKPRKIAVKSE